MWLLLDGVEMGCFLGARGVCRPLGVIDYDGGRARRSYEAGQDHDLSQLWLGHIRVATRRCGARARIVPSRSRACFGFMCWACGDYDTSATGFHIGENGGGVLLRGFLADSCCRTKPNGTPAKGP